MTSTAVVEQSLSAAELDRARVYLDQTQNEFGGAIRHIAEAQWNYKPQSGGWSIAEIVEHIALAQERILGPMREALAEAPAMPPRSDREIVDDIVILRFPNRLAKFSSPFDCAGGLGRAEGMDRVVANYSRMRETLETAPGLRTHSIQSRPLKAVSGGAYDQMDGYQWILVAAAHTERHTKQILEVMAEPGFPA